MKSSKMMFLCKYFWIFYIASIFGYCVEVLWCYYRFSRFDNRSGVIFEKINPIYGMVALILTFILYKYRNKNIVFIFFLSAVAGSMFEALCSFVQQLVFGTSSWHYGPHLWGILGGHASLMYAILWGILGVIWIKLIHPFAIKALDKVKFNVLKVLTIIFLSIFIVDVIFSSLAVIRYSNRANGVEAGNVVDEFFDKYLDDEFMKSIYPNMKVVK